VQEVLDLGETRIDPDDPCAPLGEQVLPEAAAAVHLDEQAAELAERLGTGLLQQAPLAAQHTRVRAGPSFVFPDALTPPYGIWSARNVGASFTVTPPNSRRLAASRHVRRSREKTAAWRP